MKTKLTSAITAIILALGAAPSFAQTPESRFCVLSVPCVEGETYFAENWQKYDSLAARYADDKTPIPLSAYYDGRMFATVPAENAERGIEWYLSEEKTFSDSTDNNSSDFYAMEKLSALGVISGDENGNANPNNKITRAEATAIIMRFLGLDIGDNSDSGFDDVPQDAWFATTVTSARTAGLVSGDSDGIFNPNRSITREEFTAMAARALWYAELRNKKTDVTADDLKSLVIDDAEEISEWAYSAYDALSYLNLTDYEYDDSGDEPIDRSYARPKQEITRGEAASLLEVLLQRFQSYPSQTAEFYGFDTDMPIIDGSTSTYPFTSAVYSHLFSNGQYNKNKPEKHSKSHASYERLINGEVDAIIASVYPSEDILNKAADNGVELELIPIAYDAMIFFTNRANSVEGLTTEQISDIYVNNKYENWSELGGTDALLYPYCRNNDSGSHAQMEKHFLKGNEINEQIRKESTSVAMAEILTDVMGAETDDPVGYGLGYSIYYYYHNMNYVIENDRFLKLLAIDGVYPTDETIVDGSYPLSNNTYVVINKNEPENSRARRFADFMLSPTGQQCVAEAGFGPINDNAYILDIPEAEEGCWWEISSYDRGIVDISMENVSEKNEDGALVFNGKTQFVARGLKEGNSTVTFLYQKERDGESAIPIKTISYELSVAEDGTVTVSDTYTETEY